MRRVFALSLFLFQNRDLAFHDPHRCGHTRPELGNFCEKFGNKDLGGKYGVIADWTPQYVDPENLPKKWETQPQNQETRKEISGRYTTISRMDDGISLILETTQSLNELSNSLVVFASDNGPPFLGGRTNLYPFGIRTPLIVSHPQYRTEKRRNHDPTSILDIFPTILDWFKVKVPSYKLLGRKVEYLGKSLLDQFEQGPKLKYSPSNNVRPIFATQSLHEVTMSYPMRAVYVGDMMLIQNINYQIPFPIDQDFYLSSEFQSVLRNDSDWDYTLRQYYYRPQFELFNQTRNQRENLSKDAEYKSLFDDLRSVLERWQWTTNDPWRCAPNGVLQDSGKYKEKPQCFPLKNEL